MAGKTIGRPPIKAGEKSVHIGVRVSESMLAQLLAEVERVNGRVVAAGGDPVTVSKVARTVLERGLSMSETHALPPLTGSTFTDAWESALKLAHEQGEDVPKLLADASERIEAWRAHGLDGTKASRSLRMTPASRGSSPGSLEPENGPSTRSADEVVTRAPTHTKRVSKARPEPTKCPTCGLGLLDGGQCPTPSCALVKPAMSRSMQRRLAVQRGEVDSPVFDPSGVGGPSVASGEPEGASAGHPEATEPDNVVRRPDLFEQTAPVSLTDLADILGFDAEPPKPCSYESDGRRCTLMAHGPEVTHMMPVREVTLEPEPGDGDDALPLCMLCGSTIFDPQQMCSSDTVPCVPRPEGAPICSTCGKVQASEFVSWTGYCSCIEHLDEVRARKGLPPLTEPISGAMVDIEDFNLPRAAALDADPGLGMPLDEPPVPASEDVTEKGSSGGATASSEGVLSMAEIEAMLSETPL